VVSIHISACARNDIVIAMHLRVTSCNGVAITANDKVRAVNDGIVQVGSSVGKGSSAAAAAAPLHCALLFGQGSQHAQIVQSGLDVSRLFQRVQSSDACVCNEKIQSHGPNRLGTSSSTCHRENPSQLTTVHSS